MHESGENYLETILLLKERNANGIVRSVDVAEELGYTKASISRAMRLLRESGHVQMNEDGNLELTPEGECKAKAVYERHRFISKYLEDTLALDAKIAEKDACRIEHIISPETFARIKAFVLKGMPDSNELGTE